MGRKDAVVEVTLVDESDRRLGRCMCYNMSLRLAVLGAVLSSSRIGRRGSRRPRNSKATGGDFEVRQPVMVYCTGCRVGTVGTVLYVLSSWDP